MNCSPRLRVLDTVRGALAALFFSLVCVVPAAVPAALETASPGPVALQGFGQTQLRDGLTLVARSTTLSPTAAIEIWIRCPANGYTSAQPGIARLAALSLLEQKTPKEATLREQVKRAGGQISVSVFHDGTEVALLAPGYVAAMLLDKLLNETLRPHVDRSAYLAARQRLAAQQVAATEVPDTLLREALFSQIFSNGPMHDSIFGTPQALANFKLEDVNAFLTQAYVPASEIVVATGNLDTKDVSRRVNALAPPAAGSATMPASNIAPAKPAPVILERTQVSKPGMAMGWVGPGVTDERAATALDFFADYLAYPDVGVVAKAVQQALPGATFYGQFITRTPGVFFLTVSGDKVDPNIALATVREALSKATSNQFSRVDFARALEVFRTHLLRDMQSPQQVADNYGWYFTQGAPAYSPSATDANLGGDYFAQVQSLTPEYVLEVAKRYLSVQPAVIILPRAALHTAGVVP